MQLHKKNINRTKKVSWTCCQSGIRNLENNNSEEDAINELEEEAEQEEENRMKCVALDPKHKVDQRSTFVTVTCALWQCANFLCT